MPNEDRREKEAQQRGLPPVPHLADPASLTALAVWLAKWAAAAVASGVAGGVAYDAVKAVRKCFGRRKVEELEELVYKELKKVKRKPNVSDRDLHLRVKQLIKSAGV